MNADAQADTEHVDRAGKHEEVWATEWTPSQPEGDEIARARKATVTDWMNDTEGDADE